MLSVTRLGATATAGRRIPNDPALLGLFPVPLPSRVADTVYEAPVLPGHPRYDVVSQFAQVNDVGAAIECLMTNQSDGLPYDVSEATDLAIRLTDPAGETTEFVAQLLTDGVDGKIVYVTESGDLATPGIWSAQPVITFASGVIYGEVIRFEVLSNLEVPAP